MLQSSDKKSNTLADSNIDIIGIEKSDFKELYVTAIPNPNQPSTHLMNQLAQLFQEQDARIIKMDIFASHDVFNKWSTSIRKAFGQTDWPVTYVVSEQWSGKKIAGIQTHAVTGVPVQTVTLNDYPIGRVFEDDYAKYCILGNVHPTDSSASEEVQTQKTLENLESGLILAGMNMSNIVRTWFFNHNILDWYKKFNAVRTKYYKEKTVFNGLLPASTGIGGANPYRTALIAGAIAVQPKNDRISIKQVPSLMQRPAPEYGSSFSRAVEITTPHHHHVLVSGTASIYSNGKTAHVGDINGQIDLTLNVVDAILKSRNMTFSNTSRAIAYIKNRKDTPVFKGYMTKYGIPESRVVVVHNDICRDELLFEIEVDAVLTNK